jgi:co-chaperonin GroES (HSP10)
MSTLKSCYKSVFDRAVEIGFDNIKPEDVAPCKNRIMVDVLPAEEYVGEEKLIEIPESHRKPPAMAVVVSIGPDTPGFSVGDLVLFSDSAGQEIVVAGRSFRVLITSDDLEISDVLARVPVERFDKEAKIAQE